MGRKFIREQGEEAVSFRLSKRPAMSTVLRKSPGHKRALSLGGGQDSGMEELLAQGAIHSEWPWERFKIAVILLMNIC